MGGVSKIFRDDSQKAGYSHHTYFCPSPKYVWLARLGGRGGGGGGGGGVQLNLKLELFLAIHQRMEVAFNYRAFIVVPIICATH